MVSPESFHLRSKYLLKLSDGTRIIAYFRGMIPSKRNGKNVLNLWFTNQRREWKNNEIITLYCDPAALIIAAELAPIKATCGVFIDGA